MLIHSIAEVRILFRLFPIELPCILCDRTFHKRTCGSKQPDLRIFRMNCLRKPLIAMLHIQILCLPLFISHRQKIHMERLRMSHSGPQCAPCTVHRSVGKLNEIQCILYIFLKLGIVRIHHLRGTELTRRTDIQHRKRFCVQQFTQQKIFIKSKSKGLTVMCIRPLCHWIILAPVIVKCPKIRDIAPIFHITHGIFPVITVV